MGGRVYGHVITKIFGGIDNQIFLGMGLHSCVVVCAWSSTIKMQEMQEGQYPAILTEQAWSTKDL